MKIDMKYILWFTNEWWKCFKFSLKVALVIVSFGIGVAIAGSLFGK